MVNGERPWEITALRNACVSRPMPGRRCDCSSSSNDLSEPKDRGRWVTGARYIRTRTYSAVRITFARESTRTRFLNSAIYQALLSSEPFHVAINVSTAGTSYFKALWHRHAHAKFTSRRFFSEHLYRADPAIYLLSRWQRPEDTKRELE